MLIWCVQRDNTGWYPEGTMRLGIRRGRVIAAMLVAFVTPSCTTDVHGTEPAPLDSVKLGQWSGQHIAMTVAASGTDIEFDCGKATVAAAIETDRAGSFTATG